METKPAKTGSGMMLGIALGAGIGLLFGKLVLGGIFGLLLGLVIDANRRKAAGSSDKTTSPD